MKKSVLMQLHENRDAILAVIGEIGGSNVRIYGSVSRGAEKPTSDIDMLIDREGAAGEVNLYAAAPI